MFDKLFDFYFNNYRKLIFIPLIILLFNIGVIVYTYATTGAPILMDSSLKGGVSFIFNYADEINIDNFQEYLVNNLGTDDVNIILLSSSVSSQIIGYEVQTQQGITKEELQSLTDSYLGFELNDEDISYGSQSSVIGSSFLQEAIPLLIGSFILMAIVSYFYFKNVLPALTITFSTLSDIIGILAMLDLLGIKAGIATIGALLMTIGFSTDSDILLATSILKREEDTLKTRLKKAVKTELTMTLAALITFSIMFFLSTVDVIKHISLVLLLGIIFDFINTYCESVSLQRMYLDKVKK
ncbi:hypothetical protein COX58_01585 [archaeon CG_4_10_14_0_2_um_filter_Archaea_38_6]|nr:MAG: hypothetical protein COS83_00985 [archaeon CG07_land_8_20_14_0_80_38_8]PIU88231.1 MAG: hypothetical protein COS64_04305 [archaeon CG06_land_8_20_14_3_00_37_11]PJA22647.1 MAG: hypothetical protein COX58_01585 [archaeon CG_4_10_14_0_2_um_filter_Archaea_38_6]